MSHDASGETLPTPGVFATLRRGLVWWRDGLREALPAIDPGEVSPGLLVVGNAGGAAASETASAGEPVTSPSGDPENTETTKPVSEAPDRTVRRHSGGRRPAWRAVGRLPPISGDAAVIPSPSLARTWRRAPARALTRAWADALHLELDLPAAAENELPAVLANQIDRLTPYRVDQVCFGYRVAARNRAAGRLTLAFAVLPLAACQAERDALAGAGLDVDGVWLTAPLATPTQADGLFLPFDRMPGAVPTRRRGPLPALLALLFAANSLLFYAGFWQPLQEARAAVAAREAVLAELRPRAEAAAALRRERQELERLIALLEAERRAAPDPLPLLADLSRRIPDTAWLRHLALSDGQLRITGEAREAAALIALLESSPHLGEIRFLAPIKRIHNGGADEFRIIATLQTGSK